MKLIPSRGRVSRPAYIVLMLGLKSACLLLAASLLVGVYAGEMSPFNLELCHLCAELYRAPQGILLVTGLAALILESRSQEGS